jgi:hypothetical protein
MEAVQMRRLLVIFISVLALLFTGCMKAYPLTEEETDIVAEYMAGLLLAKDKNYSLSLLSYDEVKELSNQATTNTKEEPIEETDKDNVIDNESEINSLDKTNSLSEVIGNKNFEIQFTGYKLADTYPEDETNRVFSIDPRKGNQLLIVNFTLENLNNKDMTIDLSKEKIQYQLKINGENIYKPLLVLLENNLQYINMKIAANSKIPTVLIFELEKDTDLSKISLLVSNNSKSKEIEFK